jgi:hypothetical protein
MRKFIIITAAIAVFGVAGCGSGGGGTTTVIKRATADAPPTTATTTPTYNLTPGQTDLLNKVADKNASGIAKLCRLDATDSQAAEQGFVRGFGASEKGVNGVEAYRYIIGTYC